jgi:hypothetical protein
MFDQGTQFKYFKNILKEVYKIIDINWNIKDTDTPKMIMIINKHLEQYNQKSGFLKMGSDFNEDSKILTVYLSDYVIGRGIKKRFQDEIAIQSIIRDRMIDDLLSEDDEDETDYV